MPLNCFKKYLSLETAEFDVARRIKDEPTFKWRVRCTLRRRDAIKTSVNKRIIIFTQKHGAELSTSVVHAKKIDEKMSTLIG